MDIPGLNNTSSRLFVWQRAVIRRRSLIRVAQQNHPVANGCATGYAARQLISTWQLCSLAPSWDYL
ncbi:hypothetical protein T4B_14067 [Trichinella pseudospiralis]|uniref:Uncharacterized protein n=1 Tax=Trichinella pseudospiralis TaxID=6337 RepID=A0A0V1K471_TRIPS|nr:hypothetical protein T4B_14067 [Trichinella pseudospiralis]KRZ41864.1 hypothetical protein T4C_5883 [Trichinella pseudospiralis]